MTPCPIIFSRLEIYVAKVLGILVLFQNSIISAKFPEVGVVALGVSSDAHGAISKDSGVNKVVRNKN